MASNLILGTARDGKGVHPHG